MIKLISISPTNGDDKKKYIATFKYFEGNSRVGQNRRKYKKIKFGAKGYSDYTQHRDGERKRRYILRHSRNENWSNPLTAGTLSRYILWNLPTLSASIKDFKRRFDI